MSKELKKLSVQSLFSLIILLLIYSCNDTGESLQRAIQLRDSCDIEGTHPYQLYIPSNTGKSNQLPVLFIIDSHGKASEALFKFIPTAEKYKVILVCSERIGNNYPDFAHVINLLIDDVRKKHAAADELIIAGHSGGARMALNFAQYIPVEGVIACGALADDSKIRAISKPVISIVGMADFNFIETAQYIFKPEATPENLKLIITDESHDWPSANYLQEALGYILCSEKGKAKNKNFNNRNYHREYKQLLDSLQDTGDLFTAALIARNLTSTGNEYEKISQSINKSAEYQAILGQLKESIRFELAVRNAYINALQTNDSLWWKNEIQALETNITKDQDYFRSYVYKRVKGFLGIMCYTLCQNALFTGDFPTASRILAIYSIIEPDNPDYFYFSALYQLKMNSPDLALKDLKRAIAMGFNDFSQIKKDFTLQIAKEVLSNVYQTRINEVDIEAIEQNQ